MGTFSAQQKKENSLWMMLQQTFPGKMAEAGQKSNNPFLLTF